MCWFPFLWGACGTGGGTVYIGLISTVGRWFPDRRGMAMGILTMGFGMGGLILGGIAGYLIESLGWASAFQFLALISLIICVTGGLMARFPAVGWTQADMARPQAASGPSDEMIKTKEWW